MRALALIGCVMMAATMALGPPDAAALTGMPSIEILSNPTASALPLIGLVVTLVAIALIVAVNDRRRRSSSRSPAQLIDGGRARFVGGKEVTPMLSGVNEGEVALAA